MFIVRAVKMWHKDGHNVSEQKYLGPFDSRTEAADVALKIKGSLVEIHEVFTPA